MGSKMLSLRFFCSRILFGKLRKCWGRSRRGSRKRSDRRCAVVLPCRVGFFKLLCWIWHPPSNSGKWRFRLGSPTKNVIILVVTVTVRGPHPTPMFIFKMPFVFWGGKRCWFRIVVGVWLPNAQDLYLLWSCYMLYAWDTEDYRRQRKFVFGDPFSTSMNMGGRVHSGKLT